MTTILEDEGQKVGKHEYDWEELHVKVERVPLPVGDYVLMNEKIEDVLKRKIARRVRPKKMDFLGTYTRCVDTKYDIQELVSDICGKQHERFRDECILAQNNNVKLYVLIENMGGRIPGTDVINPQISKLEDLYKWANPRLFVMERIKEVEKYNKFGQPVFKRKQKYPNATRGITLMKACMTMEKKYGVKFIFCHPDETAWWILKLLRSEENEQQQHDVLQPESIWAVSKMR